MKNKNTLQRWDEYFIKDWEKNSGIEQTEFFMLIFLSNLPQELIDKIVSNKYSIYDIGCALGQGTKMLNDYFITSKVVGGDFSKNAIEKAQKNYPNIKFRTDDLTNLQTDLVDIIFCSNVLEHFKNPQEILDGIFKKSNQYVFIMVPYKEYDLCDDHEFTFDDNFFAENMNGFYKVYERVIDCSNIPKTNWNGEQLLVIYSNNNYKYKNTINNNYFLDKIFSITHSTFIFEKEKLLDDLKIEIDKVNKKRLEQEKEIEELTKIIKEHHNTINQIYSSTSWKISKPLRVIKNNVNKFKRKKD